MTHPPIAYGTWKLPPNEDGSTLVVQALKVGFRHIDTAAAYLNEASVGAGLAAAGVARDDVLLSGKLWRTKRSERQVTRACKQSLRKLGVDHFDLYLMHWPALPEEDEAWERINAEVWGTMEGLLDEGLVREVGVCNFRPQHLEALSKYWRKPPSVNQVELQPGMPRPDVLACNRQFGMKTEAWSPLANGRLLAHPVVVACAEAVGATPAQVCLRWCQLHEAVPITASSSKTHMMESLACGEVGLDEQTMSMLDNMEPVAEPMLLPPGVGSATGGDQS